MNAAMILLAVLAVVVLIDRAMDRVVGAEDKRDLAGPPDLLGDKTDDDQGIIADNLDI